MFICFSYWAIIRFNFNMKTMILGSISVAVIIFIYHFWESQFYLYPAEISAVMLIVRVASSIVFTGVIATLIGKGLAKTGILKAYPLGQKYASEQTLEIDE